MRSVPASARITRCRSLRASSCHQDPGRSSAFRATPAKSKEGPARRQVENPNQKHTKEAVAVAGSEYIGYVEGDQTVSVKK